MPKTDKSLDPIKNLHNGIDNIWLQVKVVRRTIPRNPSVLENPNFKEQAKFADSPPSNCQVAKLVANDYNMFLAVRDDKVKAYNTLELAPDEGKIYS